MRGRRAYVWLPVRVYVWAAYVWLPVRAYVCLYVRMRGCRSRHTEMPGTQMLLKDTTLARHVNKMM